MSRFQADNDQTDKCFRHQGCVQTNFIPPIKHDEVLVQCSALKGPCIVALGRCKEDCVITIADVTPAHGVFCSIIVMLHEGAVNDNSEILSLQGHNARSHISKFVTNPGACCFINCRGGNLIFHKYNDVYHLVSEQECVYSDTKLELELNKHGFQYYTYYNPDSVVA